MTTKTTPEPTSATHIPLRLLHAAPWNEERPVDDAYVRSFRDKGQLVTALVRPHPTHEDEFEIVYGHRRAAALELAGIESMRCEVRDLSDEEAEELGAIENAQRRGLDWQQQCNLIAGYLQRHDDEDASARIGSALGITTAQVKRRARMLFALSPSWNGAIKDGSLSNWTADHFEVLAVFDEKYQETIYKDLNHDAAGMSLTDLKEAIARESKALSSAPWDPADALLVPKAGACVGCTTRSDAQPDLFGEVTGGTKAKATCLNGDCFAKKLQAYAKRKELALLEKHPEAVKVNKSYAKGPKGALRSFEVTEAKKGDKGAVAAIVYGDAGKVSLGYVKVKKDAQEKAKVLSEKDKAKIEAKKRFARVFALAVEKLSALAHDKSTQFTGDAEAILTQFCLVYGAGIEIKENAEPARIRDYRKKPITVAELWRAALLNIEQTLNRAKWSAESGWEGFEKNPHVELVCWLIDVDFADLLKDAEAEIGAPEAQPDSDPEAKAEKPAGKARAPKTADKYDAADELPGDEDDTLDGDSEGGL